MKIIIKRKTLISMVFIGLTLLGYISYRQLPVELIPNAELPFLIVQVGSRQEVDPSFMESQAIVPLEGGISTLEGIEELSSFISRRSSMIFIYYSQNTNLKYAFLRLQEKVNILKSTLPENFIVNVIKIDTEQISNTFMSLQVRGGGDVNRLRNIVDERVLRDLETVDGIAKVDVVGGQQKSVEIVLDEDICKAHNITAGQIQSQIRRNNQDKAFVGQVYDNNKRYFVNVSAEYLNIQDIENIVIRPQGPVLLRDIAEVYVGLKEEESISRINGKSAITIQLIRDAQVNLIRLSHITQDAIARINKDLESQDVEIVIQSNMAEDMEKNIDLIIELALIGGLLAVGVLWIFLRNLRLVVTILLAIPISIFTAFNFFYIFNITVNTLTLLGMALVVGMLLDNSVVVLENIYRLSSHSKDSDKNVTQGTKEVSRSIIAATLTTIAVFLPFIFSTNFLIKLVGRNVGVSVVSALFVSLVVALLLIPMITHFFLVRKHRARGDIFQIVSRKNRLMQIYTLLLKTSLRFPVRAIIGTFVLFVVCISLALAVSFSVSQEVESEEINLYVTMSSGATLESTDNVAAEVEKRLENIEEKQDVTANIYEEEAVITIKLKEDYENIDNRNAAQIKNDIEEKLDDFRLAEVSFEQPQSSRRFRGGGGGMGANMGSRFERMLGMGSQREEIVVKGRDFTRMRNLAEDIRYYLEDLSSVDYVSLSIAGDRPEIHLFFDTQLLSQRDIPISSVASEIATFQNEFNSGMMFKQGVDEIDITIRGKNTEDKNIDDLRQLNIPSPAGDVWELQQLSRIIYSSGISGINRVNQEKQIDITYQFQDEVNDAKSLRESALSEVEEVIANMKIPSGIAVEMVEQESEYEEFYYLIAAAIILIFFILASVFESLWVPFVILFSIPFAPIGSFGALILTGKSMLSTNTLMGLLILVGIVVNNGIIMIDYARILRQRGYRRSRALLMSGQARLRPILITVITTVVALIPLAMGKAEYVTIIGAPFAITVIGGLTLSTLLTLVFLPTVYAGLETVLHWIRNLSWKIRIIQLLGFVAGCWLIYTQVDGLLWQIIYLPILLGIIPALTYFLTKSLRSAKAKFIDDQDKIIIKIRNVVKIYDQEMRFVREWKKGKIFQEHFGVRKRYKSWRDFDHLIWQVPLLGFLIYFIYFYITGGFWLFVLVHILYFYLFYFWDPIYEYLCRKMKKSKAKRLGKIFTSVQPALFWGFPFLNLIIFQIRWGKIGLVACIAFLWYLALMIYTTSNRLHRQKVNVNRLTGKFVGIRKRFYRFVQVIPIIGRKKNPFKALAGVSLEIGSGMFGLLGPNGAGKTTLMRIICGILEQSYGKVTINEFDANENREELQGLIGYLPQEFGMYENMTAWEFLNYQAILKNLKDKELREKRVIAVLESVHMVDHKNEKIGSFSGGMKQRIGIAQILLHLPRILVVDEPTAGLDPRERIRFRNLLVELSRERVVIFSTHIIEDISSSCNKVAVLNRGELCYMGEPINMTKIAEGHVWQFHVALKEFESLSKDLLIVHHMRDGDRIRVRCISEKRPERGAKSVRPSLEDAYLWMLRSK